MLEPLLSVDEKEKGRLYGRSSGQEERFPNIGGLLIVRSTHRGILNRKSLGCLGDHHKRSLLIIRKLIVLCSSIFSIVHMFVYVNISYVKCKVNCILFQITICAGVDGGRVFLFSIVKKVTRQRGSDRGSACPVNLIEVGLCQQHQPLVKLTRATFREISA